MQFDKYRKQAEPNTHSICAGCNGELISKCGDINVWHWAHKSGLDCDKWHEHETDWHLGWKEHFPENDREVTIAPHRADIVHNRVNFKISLLRITSYGRGCESK